MLKSMQRSWLNEMCVKHNTVPTDLHGENCSARFEIYRSSWLENMANVMSDTYPVIKKLLGAEFFNAMSQRYIEQYHSRCGDIHLYGEYFVNFIREFEPVRELTYLPDVSRLEWMVHQVFHSADEQIIDISHLASLSMSQLETNAIKLHSGLRLLQSNFPVHDIWRVNQNNFNQHAVVNLDIGSVNLLVFRKDLEVVLLPLSLINYQFIQRLQSTKNIAEAYTNTLLLDPEFDMASVLHVLFDYELVSQISTIKSKA